MFCVCSRECLGHVIQWSLEHELGWEGGELGWEGGELGVRGPRCLCCLTRLGVCAVSGKWLNL